MVRSPQGGGGGEAAGKPRDDRRAHARFSVEAAVVLRDASGRAIEGRLVNLSAGGACVQMAYNDGHVGVGDRVDLLIEPGCGLTQWARFSSLAAVVRYRHAVRTIGVQFHRARHEIAR